jgi:DNA-binding HxlR family transcriptional regulator
MSEITLKGRLSDRENWNPGENCPLARTLDVVGARSAFLILREAFYGATRFEQFVTRAGISEPVAAARLRDLTEQGLLEKVPYREPGKRARSEYLLTQKGEELLPVLVAMLRWGDRWGFEDGARVDLTHAGCGGSVSVKMSCEHGHEVEPGELDLVLKADRPAA